MHVGPSQYGFSLVEVMVAMSVLAIAFSALLAALLGGIAAAKTQQDRQSATQLGAEVLERLQVVDWNVLGHYDADFAGGVPALNGGESVVELPAVSPRPADAPLPSTTKTVGNVAFSITTWVTWSGSSAAAPNTGTTYAAKRIETELTWTTRGEPRTFSTSALRAPTNDEMAPPSGVVGAVLPAVALTDVLVQSNQTLNASSQLTAALTLSATTASTADAVAARYVRADSSIQMVDLVPDATFRFWSATVPALTGPFSPGTLVVSFTASRTGGSSATADGTVQLAAAAASPAFSITASQVLSAVEPHTLNSAFATTAVLTFTATTSSSATGVTATYAKSDGTKPVVTLTSSNGGLSWSGSLPVGTGPLTAGTNAVTLAATAPSGSATSAASFVVAAPTVGAIGISQPVATPTLCEGKNSNAGKTTRAHLLRVNVQNADATDPVVFAFSTGTTTTWTATDTTGTSAGPAGFTYEVTVPTGTAVPSAGDQAVRITASRAADSSSSVGNFVLTVSHPNNGQC